MASLHDIMLNYAVYWVFYLRISSSIVTAFIPSLFPLWRNACCWAPGSWLSQRNDGRNWMVLQNPAVLFNKLGSRWLQHEKDSGTLHRVLLTIHHSLDFFPKNGTPFTINTVLGIKSYASVGLTCIRNECHGHFPLPELKWFDLDFRTSMQYAISELDRAWTIVLRPKL